MIYKLITRLRKYQRFNVIAYLVYQNRISLKMKYDIDVWLMIFPFLSHKSSFRNLIFISNTCTHISLRLQKIEHNALIKVTLHGTIFNATLLREKSIPCDMTIEFIATTLYEFEVCSKLCSTLRQQMLF